MTVRPETNMGVTMERPRAPTEVDRLIRAACSFDIRAMKQGYAEEYYVLFDVPDERYRYDRLLLFSRYWTAWWWFATGRAHVHPKEQALALLHSLT